MNASKANQNSRQYQGALKAVKQQLAQWRQSRLGKQIPESIWLEMAEVAREYGISPVCQSLNVNYTTLKGWVGRLLPEQPISSHGFVELKMPTAAPLDGLVVEIDPGPGAKLTLRLPRSQREDLLWLIQSLGRQGR
jgi:hypothetical protein